MYAASLALVLLCAGACALAPRAPQPIATPASEAFSHARLERRRAAPGWRERARAAAKRAAELDPTWVAPARFLDELECEDLRGPEALARHLERLRVAPASPAELYLAGRLEGRLGRPRQEASLRLDPRSPWGHHGLAWLECEAGNTARARLHGAHAAERARDPFERAFFAEALARYELAGRRVEAAIEVLRSALAEARGPDERIGIEALLARAELTSEEVPVSAAGFWRAVRLLREDELTEDEVGDLAVALLAGAERVALRSAVEEIDAALAARRSPQRDAFRARLEVERGSPALALALVPGRAVAAARASGAAALAPACRRAARLARGERTAVIEDWLAELPAVAIGADGLPRRAELRELVRAARAADADQALGEALLAAGWFEEARGYASALAASDPEAALELDRRAGEASATIAGIGDLLAAVDAGQPWTAPGTERSRSTEGRAARARDGADLGSLERLLAALQALFALHAATPETVDLVHSPRLAFGGFASIVHPGPTFSAEDEREGRGPRGGAVPGLAAELLRLGRFGIFGQSVGGGGPDGTVLRLLAFEPRSGEHLGRPFAGTAAWCEGTDVPSRPVRRGAAISGAALHEGFWIDVDVVRDDLAHWRGLERDFLDGTEADGGARATRALAVRGPELAPDAELEELAAPLLGLGAGDRIRLALLAERPARPGGRVTLEELLEATAKHEEGHLVDRARFLPLTRDPLGALALLARAGFRPAGVARLLEARAELVALASANDPRLVLADCADALEGVNGVTPHGQAYAGLMRSFLELLARDIERYPSIDPRHPLVFQLHCLGPEEVRTLATELARREDVAGQ